jgi:hypothetical protein
MVMGVDPDQVFKVMRCAYSHGVLQKFTVIQGEALQEVMSQSGLNLGDLLNLLDGAEERTVTRIEGLLNRVGPVVKYAANDRVMSLTSKLLDLGPVRKMTVAFMRNSMLKVIPDQEVPSLKQRMMALARRAA